MPRAWAAASPAFCRTRRPKPPRAGELEIVLADFSTAPLPIHLLYQDGARLPAKVRSFVSHCAERLRADPYLQAAKP